MDKSVPVFSACGGAAIYRRSVFEEIGYFDEEHFAYLEDLDIATVPGSTAMRTGMNRRRLCCIMAVLPRDPDTIPGKRYLRLPTVFM